MGLDWNPASRPRPGREREFEKAKARLNRHGEKMPWAAWLTDFLAKRFSLGRSSDQLWADFEAVAITPYETLGAPRVGMDPAATAWAKVQYDALEQKPSSLDDHLRKTHGCWVLEFVAKCDGLPV